jgi:nitrogen fixation NifU-like protein
MFEDEFAERILLHCEDPFHQGNCPAATHSTFRDNPLCGDWVRIDLVITPTGKIAEAWFDGEGCVISQAAASMLVQRAAGMTIEAARRLPARSVFELFGPGLSPERQKCCLLSWRTLQAAFDCPVANDEIENVTSYGGAGNGGLSPVK